jgi:hypothetical protein
MQPQSTASEGSILLFALTDIILFVFRIPACLLFEMLFIDFPSGLLLLLAGTDDGSLHFIKISTIETVFSLFEVYNDPIIGMAANRVDDSAHDTDHKFSGARTRLLVCDCQLDAKLWDISGITSEHITGVPLLKSWEPHPGGTTTDVIAVDDISSFMCSSDTGEISVWTIEGELRAKFAQRKTWPIADPRTSSRSVAEVEAERRAAGAGTDTESSSESDNESGPLSGMSTRRGSVMGGTSSANSRRRKLVTPPRKEISFAESHPMYLPRDECDKYLKEHAQQSLMDAAALAKERLADRERREEKSGKSHSKLGLADMLGKLEQDLKQQHERTTNMYTTGGGGGCMSLDTTTAIQGGHVYEKFHAHHATGSSVPTNALHFHGVASSSSSSHAPYDPLGDSHDRVPRPPRVRHPQTNLASTLDDRDGEPPPPHTGGTSVASVGVSSSTVAMSSRSPAVTSRLLSATVGSVSDRSRARVSFRSGARTISNSDVFIQPPTSRIRKTKLMAQDR